MERRHALAATLDEGRTTDEKEGHIAADRGSQLGTLGGSERIDRAPGIERPVEGRRRVAAAAGQARRDGNPLVQPDRERGRRGSELERTARRVASTARSTRFSAAGPVSKPST